MSSERFFYKNKAKSEFIASGVVGMDSNDDVEKNGVGLVESRVGGGEGVIVGENEKGR